MSEKTKGTCINCKKHFSQPGAKSHLLSCIPVTAVGTPHYILKISAPYAKLYWMYIAIPIKGTLYQLDTFLRDAWLQCCGHLSSFRVGQIEYPINYGSEDFMLFEGKAASMKTTIKKALPLGCTAKYEYDFGSTTELRIEAVAERSFNGKEIKLLMVNQNPQLACNKCKKSAVLIDSYGDYVCATCARDFDEETDEGLLPLVNSPRAGTCGYIGSRVINENYER